MKAYWVILDSGIAGTAKRSGRGTGPKSDRQKRSPASKSTRRKTSPNTKAKRHSCLTAYFKVIHFLFLIGLLGMTQVQAAESTLLSGSNASFPSTSFSVLRVFGSFIIVLALFCGGVWVFKNWQRLAVHKGRSPKLNIHEVKSIGGRHSLFVVGYEQQRFLVASSPGGVQLLTHLPEADTSAVSESAPAPAPAFAQALQRVLAGRS
ncbi:MAG TPA: flagellar biosynthetic protein FliO [Verrucomicrobiae bacterium]|jgi:flagellar biogenesis protein FliO